MQDRAAAVVVAEARARGMTVGRPKGQVEKGPWVREVPACAAVPTGTDVPDPADRRMCALTAAEALDKDSDEAEVLVLDPAQVRRCGSVEVRHLLLAGTAESVAEECREWVEAEARALAPAGGRECLSAEARDMGLALGEDLGAVAGRDRGKVKVRGLVPVLVRQRVLVPALNLVSVPGVDSAPAAHRVSARIEALVLALVKVEAWIPAEVRVSLVQAEDADRAAGPTVSRDSSRAEVLVSVPAVVRAWGSVVARVSTVAAGDAVQAEAPVLAPAVAALDLARRPECRMQKRPRKLSTRTRKRSRAI